MEAYKQALSDDVIFISVMTVNNEIGTIQPIREMYDMKPEGAIFHTDAVQAFGKVEVPLTDLIVGGGQEKHMRSGTENVPGIVGFGLAAELCGKGDVKRVKERLRNGILSEIKDIRINTPEEDSADSILNVSFLGTRSEVILHRLEQDGIFVSAGSACSSNKKGRSHVLTSMKMKDEEIDGAIRFSFSEFNTVEEMDFVTDRVKNAVAEFRRLGSFR